jgi:hypothetical protein
VVGRLSRRVPAVNLAAGSCYPWERQPDRIEDTQDADYLRSILGYCRVTTARDRLAGALLESLGTEVPVIPCSALLAAGDATTSGADGPVLIEYMRGAGHYDWDQGIDAGAWEDTVSQLIARLRGRHQVKFLCHDEREYRLAGRLDPSLERLRPRTVPEYFDMVRDAAAALCNRMHASVALAALGIPSVAVCTDTRLLMVEMLGLPALYVKDAGTDRLEGEIEDLIVRRSEENERLVELRRSTRRTYVDLFRQVMRPDNPLVRDPGDRPVRRPQEVGMPRSGGEIRV